MATLTDRLRTLERGADPSGYRTVCMQPGESEAAAVDRYRQETGYTGEIIPMDALDWQA